MRTGTRTMSVTLLFLLGFVAPAASASAGLRAGTLCTPNNKCWAWLPDIKKAEYRAEVEDGFGKVLHLVRTPLREPQPDRSKKGLNPTMLLYHTAAQVLGPKRVHSLASLPHTHLNSGWREQEALHIVLGREDRSRAPLQAHPRPTGHRLREGTRSQDDNGERLLQVDGG